jgi:hypothetical protein
MPVTGSCHCGAVAYTLEEEMPTSALACNCSICQRRGYLLHFTTPEAVTIAAADDAMTDYSFGKGVIQHQFCRTCGCAPVGGGTGPDGKEVIVINLRCTDGVDLDALQIQHYDGANA